VRGSDQWGSDQKSVFAVTDNWSLITSLIPRLADLQKKIVDKQVLHSMEEHLERRLGTH